jgi:hypothetical protein
MKFRILTIAALAAMSAFVFTACEKDDDDDSGSDATGTIELEFDNIAGDRDLLLDTETYTNAAGEDFNVTLFRYYISNISFEKTDGTVYTVPQDESYFLVDENDPASTLIKLNDIPAGEYNKINFTIGVDSLRNTMDVSRRTGVLDVEVNPDMYWSWNAGYIFLKLEGTSPSSPQAPDPNGNKIFQWHIGGYGGYDTQTFSNVKTVELSANNGMDAAKVGEGFNPRASITVDVLKAFDAEKVLRIEDLSIVHFNPKSVDIANNYQHMFALDNIQQ